VNVDTDILELGGLLIKWKDKALRI